MHNEAVPFRNASLCHVKEAPDSCHTVEMFPGIVVGTNDLYLTPFEVEKIAPFCIDN